MNDFYTLQNPNNLMDVYKQSDVYKQCDELINNVTADDNVTAINNDNELSIEQQYVALVEHTSAKNIIPQQFRSEQMFAVQQEGLQLFKTKNADYGDAFAEYGATGVIIRMSDKLKRFISITKTGVKLVETESLRDTLIDLHNYSAMAIMLLDEKKII